MEYFRERLRRLKEVGFNYVRFHTWVPMEPYMQAADEVGVLMGPEHSLSPTRNLLDDPRGADMVQWCRYHPSVVTYCGGNEEVGHEGLIAKFVERFRQARNSPPTPSLSPCTPCPAPKRRAAMPICPCPTTSRTGNAITTRSGSA